MKNPFTPPSLSNGVHHALVIIIIMLLAAPPLWAQYTWRSLRGAPTSGGKQDGVHFIHPDTGWVVNGAGKIYRTQDGGTTWVQQRNAAGTYFRAVHFINNKVGFAGNIGTNYFPGVTDTNPLYRTVDGGNSWIDCTPDISGSIPTGICAIDAPTPQVIYAGGRVGGPAILLKSTDGGLTWEGGDMPANCKMILDIHFSSADTGLVFAGTSADINSANALILHTTDGGINWSQVYRSTRPLEIMWKASFPTKATGYATVQSYNSNTTQRYMVKTTDGGATWRELPLVNTGVRTFGVGFINDSTGWVGGEGTGYETVDGGRTWRSKGLGQYANKFSMVRDGAGGWVGYAVGLNVFKLTATPTGTTTPEPVRPKTGLHISPNPAQRGTSVGLSVESIKGDIVKAELVQVSTGQVWPLFVGHFMGTHESPFQFPLPSVAAGAYLARFIDATGKQYQQKLAVE